jgi:hypothetical protein
MILNAIDGMSKELWGEGVLVESAICSKRRATASGLLEFNA